MNAAELAERYIDAWNAVEEGERRAALARIWNDDATYVDPLVRVSGRDELAAVIAAVQAQAPAHVFRLVAGTLDAHHDVMRFAWELVPEQGGEPVAAGFDVAVTNGDGRFASVIGFLDRAPAL